MIYLGSCASGGIDYCCGIAYDDACYTPEGCACDPVCAEYDDCCPDFESLCLWNVKVGCLQ